MLLFISAQPVTDNSTTYFIIGSLFTIVGTIIGILVSLVIARHQRNYKELSYEVVSDTPIANINNEVKDRVEIRFDGQPVEDMSLVVLRVSNTGNRAILETDYGKPLKFHFDRRTVKDGNVLSTSSKNAIDPEEMKTFLSIEQNSLSFKPLLLNPKESLTIKALVDGLSGVITGSARIAEGELIVLNSKKGTSFITICIRIILGIGGALLILHFLKPVRSVSGLSPIETLRDLIQQFWGLAFTVVAFLLFIIICMAQLTEKDRQRKYKESLMKLFPTFL